MGGDRDRPGRTAAMGKIALARGLDSGVRRERRHGRAALDGGRSSNGNTLEAVTAAWLLSRIAGFDPALRRTRDAVAFILVAAGLTPAISATIGVVTLCAAQVQPWTRFSDLWWAWWLGDAIGAIIVGPAILTSVRWHVPARVRHWAPQMLLLLGSVVATHVVFGELFGPTAGHNPLEYVIFPFLITAAVRYGQPTTALVVLGGAAAAIANTLRGSGPFADAEVHPSLVLLQVFMGVVGGTGWCSPRRSQSAKRASVVVPRRTP